MPKTIPVLEIDQPHFTVRLYENMLQIDVKGSFKNEVEEALENKPILKETLGGILSIFVPLHIALKNIDSVNVDQTGKVKIKLPHHRDVSIPLGHEDGEKLVEKLNQLVSKVRQREWELEHLRKRARDLKRKSKKTHPSSYSTLPYYYPTEQVDIVDKLKSRKRKKK